MTREMEIDFTVDVPTEAAGRLIEPTAAALGYRVELHQDDESQRWTLYCTKTMLATYDGVIAAQQELDDVSRQHGGHCDGWGTFGNRQGA